MTYKEKQSMKACLFYLYGQKNSGDAAICLGALAFLEKVGFHITAFSRWPASFPEYRIDKIYYQSRFKDIQIEGSPFKFRRKQSLITLLLYYAASFSQLFFSESTRVMKRAIRESDIVILNGGNLIRCRSVTDLLRLLAFIYPLRLARKYGVPYVIFPQSTAGINGIGKRLLSPIFKGAKAIWVREPKSLKEFSFLFPSLDFLLAPDMAFHIQNALKPHEKSKDDENLLNLSMTVRAHSIGDILEFSKQKRDELGKAIIYLISQLATQYKVDLTLVIQSDKDFKVTNEIKQNIERHDIRGLIGCKIFDSRDSEDLLSIYSKMDLLVGMRLHSLILALSKGIPCAGYFEKSWGLKNPGLLSMFGLPICFIGGNLEMFIIDIFNLVENRLSWEKRIMKINAEQKNDFYRTFGNIIDRI